MESFIPQRKCQQKLHWFTSECAAFQANVESVSSGKISNQILNTGKASVPTIINRPVVILLLDKAKLFT